MKCADNLVRIREERMPQKSFRLSLDEDDSFEDFRIDGRVMLKWNLKNQTAGFGLNLSGSI